MRKTDIVCPWRIKRTKTISHDGLVCIEETIEEFEECYQDLCPFFEFNNPGAGYPSECNRPKFQQ